MDSPSTNSTSLHAGLNIYDPALPIRDMASNITCISSGHFKGKADAFSKRTHGQTQKKIISESSQIKTFVKNNGVATHHTQNMAKHKKKHDQVKRFKNSQTFSSLPRFKSNVFKFQVKRFQVKDRHTFKKYDLTQ